MQARLSFVIRNRFAKFPVRGHIIPLPWVPPIYELGVFRPCDSIRPFSDGAPIMWSNSGGCPALARWFMSHIVTVTRLIGAGAVKEARTAFIVARSPDAG